MSNKAKKSPKGTVSMESFQERLRLRWRFAGKRYVLYIGLPDSKINRQVAHQKAMMIELDMASGNFDCSLKKYKPYVQDTSSITVVELFEKFTASKKKLLVLRSLEKYSATLKYSNSFFKSKAAITVDFGEAEKFTDWLINQDLSPAVCRERLILIRAAWKWGIKQEYLELNPWKDMILTVKVPPKQMPRPFSMDEMSSIVQAFKSNYYYSYYADYVEFLFSTGCRTAEAIGLKWKHLNHDCSSVWIGESLTRGIRKSTKTNRARTITLTPKLQQMLLSRRTESYEPEALVFTSVRGEAIDDHNFRNRAWKSVLQELGIDYRKPYTTRHTFISRALDKGMNPVEVAQLTGHDVQTLYENYAGVVSSRPRLPVLL